MENLVNNISSKEASGISASVRNWSLHPKRCNHVIEIESKIILVILQLFKGI